MSAMDLKGLQGSALQDRSRLEGELSALLEKVASLRLMKAALPQALADEWERVEIDLNRKVLDLMLGLRAFGCEFMVVEDIPDSSESEVASTGPVSELNIETEYDGVRPADAATDLPSEAVPAADDPARSNAPTDSAADEFPKADEAPIVNASVHGTEETLASHVLLSVDPILTPPPVRLGAKAKPAPAVALLIEWRDELRKMLEQWLPWQETSGEVRRLMSLVGAFQLWRGMPTDAVRYVLECAAARIRSLQDRHIVSERDCVEAVTLLHDIRLRNGDFFAYGLSRDHQPRKGDWDADALESLRGLRRRFGVDVTVSWSLNPVAPTAPSPQPAFPRTNGTPARVRPVAEKPARSDAVLDAPSPLRLADDKARSLIAEIEAAGQLAEETTGDDGCAAATLLDELRHAFAEGLPLDDERLVPLCEPYLDILAGDEFERLRAAIARSVETLADDEEGPIPPDWPLFAKTRGCRAVIVGGNPSEERRVKIESAFRFASLEWRGSRRPRVIQGLTQGIRSGGVDFVIMLRFLWHSQVNNLRDACEEQGIPYVFMEHGYNIARIRQAIEIHFGNGRGGHTR